ncbi:MAG: cation diffusion facilitator family transporter [Oscillochloridaceae bacterium umkhey_bin13]
MTTPSLTKYAWISVAAAVATISLKLGAYNLTGSVGLLSDALESLVNLVAALMALAMLTIAARPPDEDHAYGHGKAEYFASAVEGLLILIAALSIIWAAWSRLRDPMPISEPLLGIAIAGVASAINFGVARLLFTAGEQHRSIALEADAHHLMTDVWTSVGVIIGVVLITLTGWLWLDPVIALAVAVQIIWAGYQLVRRSVLGLMDTALSNEEQNQVCAVLDGFAPRGVSYHALRTRQAASRRFVSMHLLMPDHWTIQQGHNLAEEIERAIRQALPHTTVFTHIEPRDDPTSSADLSLDRNE